MAVVPDKHATTAFPNLPEHNSTSLTYLTLLASSLQHTTPLTHQSTHSNEVQLLP